MPSSVTRCQPSSPSGTRVSRRRRDAASLPAPAVHGESHVRGLAVSLEEEPQVDAACVVRPQRGMRRRRDASLAVVRPPAVTELRDVTRRVGHRGGRRRPAAAPCEQRDRPVLRLRPVAVAASASHAKAAVSGAAGLSRNSPPWKTTLVTPSVEQGAPAGRVQSPQLICRQLLRDLVGLHGRERRVALRPLPRRLRRVVEVDAAVVDARAEDGHLEHATGRAVAQRRVGGVALVGRRRPRTSSRAGRRAGGRRRGRRDHDAPGAARATAALASAAASTA